MSQAAAETELPRRGFHLDFLKDSAAGFCSAVTHSLVGHPFDTVKVRLQTSPAGTFSGPLDCVAQTVKREGFFALYKGMVPMLLGSQIIHAVVFSSYQFFRRQLNHTYQFVGAKGMKKPTVEEFRASLGDVMIAGAGAGVFTGIILTPVEQLKVRMQVQYRTEKHLRRNIGQVVVDLAKERGGYRIGLTRGFTATIIREAGGCPFWFGAYEIARYYLSDENGHVSPFRSAMAGACGGTTFWMLAYPMDSIKSRMQTSMQYRNTWDCVKSSLAEPAGLRGLYRGFTVSLMRATPSAAMMASTYELVRRFIATQTES